MADSHSPLPEIETELYRVAISGDRLPQSLRLAVEAGIITENTTFLQWGNTPHAPADVVYLDNQSPDELPNTLLAAWQLATKVLIVSVPVPIDDRINGQIIYKNGIVTRPNPSLTYFTQEQLRIYINESLNVDTAVPDSLGVYFVFKNLKNAELFRAYRWLKFSQNYQNLLLYVACDRPDFQNLPPEIRDRLITAFGSCDRAEELAIELRSQLDEPGIIANCCDRSPLGKKLPGAFYIHISALAQLDPLLRLYEGCARRAIGCIENVTLVKFNTDKPKISYLFYPDFDTDPHPALQSSIQINLPALNISYRDYNFADNPPVLHRKDAFVTSDYPDYETFVNLTRQEEEWGLLNNTRGIGTRQGWLKCLEDFGVEIEGHQLMRRRNLPDDWMPKIERHKAAIIRSDFSRPVRLALESGIFTQDSTFFDYGCGHGGDFTRIAERGFVSAGWDPYYFPENPRIPADIVNIGYVINVIEDKAERQDALLKAWELAGKVLLVAAQVLIDNSGNGLMAYGDGIITRRNTFQKYYAQEELKIYIDQVLGVEAIPAALGIYFVFRDESQAETFRASRWRSRTTTPRVRTPSKSFEDCQELLAPLMAFISDRGRLPLKGELLQEQEIKAEIGSIRRAFQLILQATDQQEWQVIADKRRQDILAYLALNNFGRLPKFSTFSPEIKNDIKAFFGSYRQACDDAEEILFSIGDLSMIRDRCQASKIGLNLPNSLCVHVSAFESLDPLLRLYEGCASRTIGRMDGVTLIKIHTDKPKISYLFYPDFDTDPHPALHTSMHIDLRNLHVSYQDFYTSDDPPILHCKDACVTPDYPNYKKFAKLTRQEENWGLLDDFGAIRTRSLWLKCLQDRCAEIRNYQVFWRKDADPYRVKLVRSARNARRRQKSQLSENVTDEENELSKG